VVVVVVVGVGCEEIAVGNTSVIDSTLRGCAPVAAPDLFFRRP
jgi:hypothetical protein